MSDRDMLFGLEHEVPFLREDGGFADFSNTVFEEFEAVIQELPVYPDDYPALRIGDAGIKVKRWYVEGFERFDEHGVLVTAVPKGIEIRTTPHPSIQGVLDEFQESLDLLREKASAHGFQPTCVSFNPFQEKFTPDPPLNPYERNRRDRSPEEQTAHLTMLTYGPDLNMSVEGWTDDDLIDAGRKLTYYSPFLVPFSFSSPFFNGKLWDGLSRRTYVRTGIRPSVMVFLHDEGNFFESRPSLVQKARLEAEKGRIEFKAFDVCGDLAVYGALFALLKGLLLHGSLPGRRGVPDKSLHRRSAQEGFRNAKISREAAKVLEAAGQALGDDPDREYLLVLHDMINKKSVPADRLIDAYNRKKSIHSALGDRLAFPSGPV